MSKPRVTEPERRQGIIRFETPEDTLELEHPARVLWQALGRLDLSAFLANARAREGRAGRPTFCPRMMLTLWTYAISRGVGSAREIERLIESDKAFQWIVGDVSVSHHALSMFRVGHQAALDKLMTDVLAVLMHKGVLSLRLVAQDGMRVRAAASAPSFRRRDALEECREQAALHLKATLAQADDPELSSQVKAAREAKARDFQRRVEEAAATVALLQSQRSASDSPARASTTDADARVMKVADGGFRPSLNVQMATAGSEHGGPRTIVGVIVNSVGSDMSGVTPMLDQIERRTAQLPQVLLADANHANHAAIIDARDRGVDALIPVPKKRGRASERNKADADPRVTAWMNRMQEDDAKRAYRARAGLCEWTNAQATGRCGIRQFLVRGVAKATSVMLLFALTINLTQHHTTIIGAA